MHYRGRFAPSPTGPLHQGSLIAALGSYLDARARGGQWLLRIDDLDPPREQPGAAAHILRQLEAHGLEWDGAVVYQSQRVEAYAAALAWLRQRGLAYPCACTRRNLLAARGQYPGTCRAGLPPGTRARAVRVTTATAADIAYDDAVCGPQHLALADQGGDFIVRRADGPYAYHLAVVVDDAAAGITHVVRGADLLAVTAPQIYLQQCLGVATPRYAHLPLLTNAHGQKLSKQTQAPALEAPAALQNLLAAYRFLGQQLPAALPASVAEFLRFAAARWQLARVTGDTGNSCLGDGS